MWSIHVPAARPDVILVGVRPSAFYRSDDGGQTWAVAAATVETACPRILHTRVTTIVADPDNPDLAWAGVEIDGVHASRDGGRTWAPVGTGLSSRDIHALVVAPKPGGGRRLLAATNNDLNVSDDDGATWRPLGIGGVLPWPYCRALAQPVGRPEVVLLGAGDGPPGGVGTVAAVGGRRQRLGRGGHAGAGQQHDLGLRRPRRRPGPRLRGQRQRRTLPLHRRRRLLGETGPRIRRNPRPWPGPLTLNPSPPRGRGVGGEG